MKKEETRSLFNSQDGKINVLLLFSILLIFAFMMLAVNAVITITLVAPVDGSINGSSARQVNFSFTPIWNGDNDDSGNCSVWTNITGTWAEAAVNSSNNSVINNTVSTINATFDRDMGNFSWAIGCTNKSNGVFNFSVNRTLSMDSGAPAVIADTPKGLIQNNLHLNITGYTHVTANFSDNGSLAAVYYVLNSLNGGLGTNETVSALSRNMSLFAGSYNASIPLDFNSSFRGPGIHSIYFCANDTFARQTCRGPFDFVVSGVNISQMETLFSALPNVNPDGGASTFNFGGLNITYGNGTEITADSFFNPLGGNFTFIFNITGGPSIYIVGGRLNENNLSAAGKTNFSREITPEVRQATGTGYRSNLSWFDIASFIPSEVSYEFGIIAMPGIFSKKLYCNGTSVSNPNCFTVNRCNATAFNIFNSTRVIPPNSACWLDSGTTGIFWDVAGVSNLSNSGTTYMFVDHFSGPVGGNDFGGPDNITFSAPTDFLNVSTAGERTITFSVFDTNSTGINLTRNGTINVTIFLGGSNLSFFNYTNQSNINRLTCTTADIVSPQNTTAVSCNLSFNFAYNGTYTINVSASDTSNNTNFGNNATRITVDNIKPVISYFNITNSSTFNASGGDFANTTELGSVDPAAVPAGGGSWAQGNRTLWAVANWTDNLTRPVNAILQFYNVSKNDWVTINTTNVTPSATSVGGWTNISFAVPTGHNDFEGRNITFRLVVNDSVQNLENSSNRTITINDTTKPTITVTINDLVHLNGTNTSDTTPKIIWNVTENNRLRNISVRIDGSSSIPCNKYTLFEEADDLTKSNRNGSITVSSTEACPDYTKRKPARLDFQQHD
ncbi:hypothetical protein J4204_03840 [Candidatus Woesearchaeota archaeon]|nr:hypothetical protein [Candidatus Woesearchaeota archaeon]